MTVLVRFALAPKRTKTAILCRMISYILHQAPLCYRQQSFIHRKGQFRLHPVHRRVRKFLPFPDQSRFNMLTGMHQVFRKRFQVLSMNPPILLIVPLKDA